MSLVEKAQEMVGKSYLYHAHEFKILGFAMEDGEIHIFTDKRTIIGKANHDFLNEFLPIEEEADRKALLLLPDKKQMNNLKDIILDNIQRVKENKSYIPQANSINQNINTLLNMARLELEYFKVMKK